MLQTHSLFCFLFLSQGVSQVLCLSTFVVSLSMCFAHFSKENGRKECIRPSNFHTFSQWKGRKGAKHKGESHHLSRLSTRGAEGAEGAVFLQVVSSSSNNYYVFTLYIIVITTLSRTPSNLTIQHQYILFRISS